MTDQMLHVQFSYYCRALYYIFNDFEFMYKLFHIYDMFNFFEFFQKQKLFNVGSVMKKNHH